MTYLVSRQFERRLLDRKNRQNALRKQGASADPQTVARMSGISHNWPGLRPGAVVGFAQAGFDEHAPEVKEAAKLAHKQNSNENRWRVQLEEYTQEDVDEEVAAKKPDPQFVMQALLPKWKEHQEKYSDIETWKGKSEEWQNKRIQENRELYQGLAYATLHYNDKQLVSIGRQMGLSRKQRDDLKSLASQARSEHELAGAGDITNLPYAGPALNVLKPVVREAAVAANFPLEVIQANARNLAQNVTEGDWVYDTDPKVSPIDQTQLGTQVKNWMEGETTNVGDGFLPSLDSPVAEQTVEAQRQAAPTIGGHAWSVGRFTANQFFEPDTIPFQVSSGFIDGAVAFYGDPTAAAVGTVADLRQNARRFAPEVAALTDATGVMPTSSRLHMVQQTKSEFLAGDKARKEAEKLVELHHGNPAAVFRRINNANPAAPAYPITTVHGEPLIEQLADSNDADELLSVMERTSQVQTKFKAPGVSYYLKNALDYRALAAMPRGTIDITDKNHAFKMMDDIMRAGSVPMAERDEALNVMIRSNDQFAAITAGGDTIANVLVSKFNVDPIAAKQYGNFFAEANKSSRAFDTDQLTGSTRIRPGVTIAGKAHVIDSPRMITEGLNAPLQIPDLRALRRIASDLNVLTGTKAWKEGQLALRAPQAFWSPLQIISARQSTRDLFETQINLAARGYINWFTDPVQVLGTVIGAAPGSRLATWLDRIPGVDGRYMFDAEANNLVANTDDLLMHSMLQFTDPQKMLTSGYIDVQRNHPEAARGFVEELGRMNGDPIMKYLAGASDPAAAKAWFWAGEGKEHRLARAPMLKRIDEHRMSMIASGELPEGSVHIPYGDIDTDRVAADKFIDEVMYPSLADQTHGSLELLDAVRDGTLNGHSLIKRANSVSGEDLSVVHEAARQRAREILDEGFGPQSSIKIREELPVVSLEHGKDVTNRILENMFHYMVDVPDKYLNRNLVWQQTQWRSYIDNAHMLSAEDLGNLKELARRNRISREQMRALNNVKTDVSAQRRFTLKELTKIGKYEAASEMTKIVHDLSSRSQFFDMVKFMVPFGDAFRLVAYRMAKLAADEPQVIRRAQQGIQAARQPESSTVNRLLGDPVPEGQPFFHDDGNGNEVAIFPLSTKFNEAVWKLQNQAADVTGLPIGPGGNPVGVPMVLHTQGLKMVGELIPGFGGPVSTVASTWLIPEGTLPEQVENTLYPYGYPQSKGIAADIGGMFIPKSVQRMMGGPIDQAALASGVNEQLAILPETGDYNLDDPRDVVRMAEDARDNAIYFERMKGFGAFSMPGYPDFEFSVKDKDGKTVLLQTVGKLISDHSLDKKGNRDPDKGMKWFLKEFGKENIFAIQAAYRMAGFGAPVTAAGKQWVDDHPEVKQAGPLVYGLFAPSYDEDIDNWNNLVAEGEAEPMTAEEQIAAAQNRLGQYMLAQKKEQRIKDNGGAALADNQEEWFREEYIPDLKKELPGFDSYIANPFDTRKKRESAIEQLQAVAKLPAVQKTGAGKALIGYLEDRDKAIEKAKGPYDLASPWQAKKAKPLRDWLRDNAQGYIAEHPEFRPLWEQIFSREMTKDVE